MSSDAADALTKIVLQNLDLDNILHELRSCPSKDVSWLCPSSSSMICVLEKLVSSIYVKGTVDLVYLSDDTQFEKIETIVLEIKKLDINKRQEIIDALCSQKQKPLPLELFCLFDKHFIISLDEYFIRTRNIGNLNAILCKGIVKLFLTPKTSNSRTKWMASSVMEMIVNCIFEGETEASARNACSSVLDLMIQRVITCSNLPLVQSDERINFLSAAIRIQGIPHSKLSLLAKYTLLAIINTKSTTKATSTDAIQNQHLWLCKFNSPFYNDILHKIIVILEPKAIIEQIESVLDVPGNEFKWQPILAVLSVLIIAREDGFDIIHGFIDKCLKHSFSILQNEFLVNNLILARHVSLEKSTKLNYEQWFDKHFSFVSTSYANTPKTFTFLMKCLTILVPFEQAQFLKAHIMKPPHVPSKCRPLLNEYLVLAKTRLVDLNEPFDEGSTIFGSKSWLKTEEQAKIDLKVALESYESTNKIPSSVIEASFLRKSYFTEKFLKVLLEPRVLPDVPDVRIEFIDELKKGGQIPQGLYDKYIEKCQLEAVKFFEGLEEDIVMDSVELNLEPVKELQLCLNNFFYSVTGLGYGDDIFPLVNTVSTKIGLCLNLLSVTDHSKSGYSYTDLSLDYPQTNEIIESIVNCFCKTMEFFANHPKLVPGDGAGAVWDNFFVTMLSWHKILELPLLNYLWKNLSSSSVIPNFKGFCLLFCRISQIFDSYIFEKGLDKIRFAPWLFDQLEIQTNDQRELFLKLSVEYLQMILSDNTSDISKEEGLFKKFSFVVLCQKPNLRDSAIGLDNELDEVSRIYTSENYINNMQNFKLTLEDLVNFESKIEVDLISFDERKERLRFWYNYCKIQPKDCIIILFKHMMEDKNPTFFLLNNFIQELVYELEPANEEIPWLQKLFLDILETDVENCPLFPQHRINTFIRLACGLPPYLFFTNHPNECVTQQALQNFAMIINQWLKPHVTELGFFSKKLTQFLFNAIIRSDNADVVLKYIIVKCPIIVASVVCHFPLLSSSYSIRKNPYTEDFLRDLGMCFADISSICNQTCLPTELIGLQLYKSGLRNMLKAIERRLFSSEILQSATQFLVFNQVLQFSTSKPTKEWPLETLKQISESPSIIYFFKNKMEEEGFVAKVFNDRYISIYPLVCSMLMLQIFETETVEALPIDSRILTLQILLENLSLCEQFTDGMDIPPMAEHVISIASVSKRLIVIIANKIPTLILKAIPGEIWQKCDVPIQMTVHQRLQNG